VNFALYFAIPVLVVVGLLMLTRRRGNPGERGTDPRANRDLGADAGPPMTNPLGGGTHGGSGFGP
jgi:hypothetical protein